MKKIISVIFISLISIFLISCQPKVHKVSFYDEEELIEVVKVKNNEVIGKDINYNKKGYEFLYWEYEDRKFDLFNEKITKSINLIAKLRKITDDTYINFYYLNDFHGAVLEKGSQIGISKIANLIKSEKQKNNTIFITGGDMLQGQYISNFNKGAVLIESFNEMGLDAFVIGNHEFDWGLDEVLKYFDNTYDIQANFPILGANVIDKRTNKIPDAIQPYTIINKADKKIGIIGVIGDGLEGSISADKVKDYYFSSSVNAVNKYSKILKEKEKVDLIAVVNHSASQQFNQIVSQNKDIDLIFNGHSHTEYTGFVNSKPYIQSKANGEKVGLIKYNFNKASEIKNLDRSSDERLNYDDSKVLEIVNKYYELAKNFYEDVLIETSSYFSKKDISNLITEIMRVYTKSDIGVQNNGGTRSSFNNNEKLTKAKLFEVFPFDNKVVIANVYGRDLKNFLNGSWITTTYNDNLSLSNLKDDQIYKLATNDYVFNGNEFLSENGYEIYELDLFELFVKAIEDLNKRGEKYLYKGIKIGD